jgi:hypothetical protein
MKLGAYQNRLARDVAAFLDKRRLDPRSYGMEWYLYVPAALPIGIPILTMGGALPGAAGFGLAAACYAIAQQERWPVGLRIAAELGLAGLVYALLIVVLGFSLAAKMPAAKPGPEQPAVPAPVQQPARPPAATRAIDWDVQSRPGWMRRDPASPRDLPGLIGYWSCDEASGDRVVDGSGNSADGILHGGRRIKGIRGNALLLDGTTDYMDYGDSTRFTFRANGPFALAVWFRSVGPGCIVSQRRNSDGGPVIDVTLESNGALAALVREDRGELGIPARVSGGRVNDGQWHHAALTRGAGPSIELFLAGVSLGRATGTNAGASLTTDLRALGSERYWVTHHQTAFGVPYLAGAVDDFCVFDRALTAKEIESLAGK